MDGVLAGVAGIAGVTVGAGALIGALLYHGELLRWGRRLLGRAVAPPEATRRPPIERIARDVRRLRSDVRSLAPGTPMARRRGVVQAYDDLLAEACRALDVPDTLSDAAPSRRAVERLRVEAALDRAGLRLDT